MLVIALFILIASVATGIRVSQVPFKYNIKTRNWRNSTQLVTGRTHSQFFQNVFGIKPGGSSSLNYDKWMGLKGSGLYTNLTLEAVVDENGDLQFLVSGIENPSKTFSPEVSLSSTRFGEPQISGGVSFSM